jgi:hypothetical protein
MFLGMKQLITLACVRSSTARRKIYSQMHLVTTLSAKDIFCFTPSSLRFCGIGRFDPVAKPRHAGEIKAREEIEYMSR